MSSSHFASLVKIILSSNITTEEKEQLLLELNSHEKKLLESQQLLEKKMLESQLRESLEKNSLEKKNSALEIQLRDERIQHLIREKEHLEKDKERETLYRLHYEQLLTVRYVIENYEKSFGDKLQKKNISRKDKWKEFLGASDAHSKPFKDAGLDIEQVSSNIDVIFKRHSAEIHSVKVVQQLVLESRGLLTDEEMTIVKIIIKNSPWSDLLSIE